MARSGRAPKRLYVVCSDQLDWQASDLKYGDVYTHRETAQRVAAGRNQTRDEDVAGWHVEVYERTRRTR